MFFITIYQISLVQIGEKKYDTKLREFDIKNIGKIRIFEEKI